MIQTQPGHGDSDVGPACPVCQNHWGCSAPRPTELSQIQGHLWWSCPHARKRSGNKAQRDIGHFLTGLTQPLLRPRPPEDSSIIVPGPIRVPGSIITPSSI